MHIHSTQLQSTQTYIPVSSPFAAQSPQFLIFWCHFSPQIFCTQSLPQPLFLGLKLKYEDLEKSEPSLFARWLVTSGEEFGIKWNLFHFLMFKNNKKLPLMTPELRCFLLWGHATKIKLCLHLRTMHAASSSLFICQFPFPLYNEITSSVAFQDGAVWLHSLCSEYYFHSL